MTTYSLMLALMAAGYGVGFSTAAHVVAFRQADGIVRPLVDDLEALTTYLLYPEDARSETLRHCIDRAQRTGQLLLAISGSHEAASGGLADSVFVKVPDLFFHGGIPWTRCTSALYAGVAPGRGWHPAMKIACPS